MVDIVITATSVVAGAGCQTQHGTAGATIAAGQLVYLDSTTGKFALTDGDSATVAARTPRGMALNGGAVNQPIKIAKAGPVTLGAVLTAGVAYYMSDDAGGICPVADLASGDRTSGLHEVRWDGRQAGGGPAPAGVYWVELTGPGGTDAARLVRTR